MIWNPTSKPFCRDCQYYEAKGHYVYLLERDKTERVCRHLHRCSRVDKMNTGYEQVTFLKDGDSDEED